MPKTVIQVKVSLGTLTICGKVGNRDIAKAKVVIDIRLIPAIYLIRMTITTLAFAISLLPTLSQIVKVPRDTLTWITVFGIHFALRVLQLVHKIVQIRPI